jgi:hypothetical protein
VTVFFVLAAILIVGIAVIALHDLTQRKHAITRNFPVLGHVRYWFEELGQPLRQYLFAGDLDERPYNRVTRSWVYASAKGQNNLLGFGSQIDPHEPGRVFIVPSLYPTVNRVAGRDEDLPRPRIIGDVARRRRRVAPHRVIARDPTLVGPRPLRRLAIACWNCSSSERRLAATGWRSEEAVRLEDKTGVVHEQVEPLLNSASYCSCRSRFSSLACTIAHRVRGLLQASGCCWAFISQAPGSRPRGAATRVDCEMARPLAVLGRSSDRVSKSPSDTMKYAVGLTGRVSLEWIAVLSEATPPAASRRFRTRTAPSRGVR